MTELIAKAAPQTRIGDLGIDDSSFHTQTQDEAS